MSEKPDAPLGLEQLRRSPRDWRNGNPRPRVAPGLSGTSTLLDADASDDVSVSKVEFHLTGGSYHDTFIGVATPTKYGWIYHWDTTAVPNGAYTINSVATDPAGNVGRSTGVSITVQN